jgi:hypothetical protein
MSSEIVISDEDKQFVQESINAARIRALQQNVLFSLSGSITEEVCFDIVGNLFSLI